MDVQIDFALQMAAKYFDRLRLLYRELGAVATILYLADQILRRIPAQGKIVYYRFLAQRLHKDARLPPERGKAYAFQLLKSTHPALGVLDRPSEIITQRFASGAQCLLATKRKSLVGCVWFIHKTYLEDEVRVEYLMPENGYCVWDFDVYVVPSERLGWLFVKQWDAFDALLRPCGVRYTLSRINAFNQRSLDSHKRLGATDCGWALFLCIGNRQLMLSSFPPYVAWGGLPKLHIYPRH